MSKYITEADIKAASRLKFIAQTSQEKLNQSQIAKAMGFESQGSVSQFFNGKIKLNMETTCKFAKLFGVDPTEIRPDLEEALQNKDKVVLVDYNKVIETVEMTLLDLNTHLDYKTKIKIYEVSYNIFKSSRDNQGIKQVQEMVALMAK
tara:strand:- start:423 stop:866 length:444 start_codon:yes stop_codon:yes gene_type:complete